jgi:hypothetical protein
LDAPGGIQVGRRDQEGMSMSLRLFEDASGREWQVWDTKPQSPADARRFSQNARLLAEAQRRSVGGTAPDQSSVSFQDSVAEGWLTFLSGTEKRRLSPIPPHWMRATEAELCELCDRAIPVDQRLRAS